MTASDGKVRIIIRSCDAKTQEVEGSEPVPGQHCLSGKHAECVVPWMIRFAIRGVGNREGAEGHARGGDAERVVVGRLFGSHSRGYPS